MIQAIDREQKEREITDELQEKIKPQDIIVTRTEKITTYDENGTMTVKRIKHRINVSKIVNETKKIVLNDQATKKLNEIEKIFKTN